MFGLDPRTCTSEEISSLKNALKQDVESMKAGLQDPKEYDAKKCYVYAGTVKRILNKKAGLSWTTSGHTHHPTLTSAYGPGAAEFMKDMKDNTDIGKRLMKIIFQKITTLHKNHCK